MKKILTSLLLLFLWSWPQFSLGGESRISPPVAAKMAKPAHFHTLRIRLWSGGPALELARLDARQSRDLGQKMRQAASRGELSPYPGCHKFYLEFRNVEYELAHGLSIHLNGKPVKIPDDFGPGNNSFEVEVCNGEGALMLTETERWIGSEAFIRVHSPWKRPDIHYPPSGVLRTCAGAEISAGKCGAKLMEKKELEFGELYRLIHERADSSYHFAK